MSDSTEVAPNVHHRTQILETGIDQLVDKLVTWPSSNISSIKGET